MFVCLFVCLFVIIGKTAIANRTAAYLRFFHGLECRVFDVASHRRDHVGYMTSEYYDDTLGSAEDMQRLVVSRQASQLVSPSVDESV